MKRAAVQSRARSPNGGDRGCGRAADTVAEGDGVDATPKVYDTHNIHWITDIAKAKFLTPCLVPGKRRPLMENALVLQSTMSTQQREPQRPWQDVTLVIEPHELVRQWGVARIPTAEDHPASIPLPAPGTRVYVPLRLHIRVGEPRDSTLEPPSPHVEQDMEALESQPQLNHEMATRIRMLETDTSVARAIYPRLCTTMRWRYDWAILQVARQWRDTAVMQAASLVGRRDGEDDYEEDTRLLYYGTDMDYDLLPPMLREQCQALKHAWAPSSRELYEHVIGRVGARKDPRTAEADRMSKKQEDHQSRDVARATKFRRETVFARSLQNDSEGKGSCQARLIPFVGVLTSKFTPNNILADKSETEPPRPAMTRAMLAFPGARTLYQHLEDCRPIGSMEFVRWLQDILATVISLHEQFVTHGDVCARTCVLAADKPQHAQDSQANHSEEAPPPSVQHSLSRLSALYDIDSTSVSASASRSGTRHASPPDSRPDSTPGSRQGSRPSSRQSASGVSPPPTSRIPGFHLTRTQSTLEQAKPPIFGGYAQIPRRPDSDLDGPHAGRLRCWLEQTQTCKFYEELAGLRCRRRAPVIAIHQDNRAEAEEMREDMMEFSRGVFDDLWNVGILAIEMVLREPCHPVRRRHIRVHGISDDEVTHIAAIAPEPLRNGLKAFLQSVLIPAGSLADEMLVQKQDAGNEAEEGNEFFDSDDESDTFIQKTASPSLARPGSANYDLNVRRPGVARKRRRRPRKKSTVGNNEEPPETEESRAAAAGISIRKRRPLSSQERPTVVCRMLSPMVQAEHVLLQQLRKVNLSVDSGAVTHEDYGWIQEVEADELLKKKVRSAKLLALADEGRENAQKRVNEDAKRVRWAMMTKEERQRIADRKAARLEAARRREERHQAMLSASFMHWGDFKLVNWLTDKVSKFLVTFGQLTAQETSRKLRRMAMSAKHARDMRHDPMIESLFLVLVVMDGWSLPEEKEIGFPSSTDDGASSIGLSSAAAGARGATAVSGNASIASVTGAGGNAPTDAASVQSMYSDATSPYRFRSRYETDADSIATGGDNAGNGDEHNAGDDDGGKHKHHKSKQNKHKRKHKHKHKERGDDNIAGAESGGEEQHDAQTHASRASKDSTATQRARYLVGGIEYLEQILSLRCERFVAVFRDELRLASWSARYVHERLTREHAIADSRVETSATANVLSAAQKAAKKVAILSRMIERSDFVQSLCVAIRVKLGMHGAGGDAGPERSDDVRVWENAAAQLLSRCLCQAHATVRSEMTHGQHVAASVLQSRARGMRVRRLVAMVWDAAEEQVQEEQERLRQQRLREGLVDAEEWEAWLFEDESNALDRDELIRDALSRKLLYNPAAMRDVYSVLDPDSITADTNSLTQSVETQGEEGEASDSEAGPSNLTQHGQESLTTGATTSSATAAQRRHVAGGHQNEWVIAADGVFASKATIQMPKGLFRWMRLVPELAKRLTVDTLVTETSMLPEHLRAPGSLHGGRAAIAVLEQREEDENTQAHRARTGIAGDGDQIANDSKGTSFEAGPRENQSPQEEEEEQERQSDSRRAVPLPPEPPTSVSAVTHSTALSRPCPTVWLSLTLEDAGASFLGSPDSGGTVKTIERVLSNGSGNGKKEAGRKRTGSGAPAFQQLSEEKEILDDAVSETTSFTEGSSSVGSEEEGAEYVDEEELKQVATVSVRTAAVYALIPCLFKGLSNTEWREFTHIAPHSTDAFEEADIARMRGLFRVTCEGLNPRTRYAVHFRVDPRLERMIFLLKYRQERSFKAAVQRNVQKLLRNRRREHPAGANAGADAEDEELMQQLAQEAAKSMVTERRERYTLQCLLAVVRGSIDSITIHTTADLPAAPRGLRVRAMTYTSVLQEDGDGRAPHGTSHLSVEEYLSVSARVAGKVHQRVALKVSWKRAAGNGSRVTQYIAERRRLRPDLSIPRGPEDGTEWEEVYHGMLCDFVDVPSAGGVPPEFSKLQYRVKAKNMIGWGEFSTVVSAPSHDPTKGRRSSTGSTSSSDQPASLLTSDMRTDSLSTYTARDQPGADQVEGAPASGGIWMPSTVPKEVSQQPPYGGARQKKRTLQAPESSVSTESALQPAQRGQDSGSKRVSPLPTGVTPEESAPGSGMYMPSDSLSLLSSSLVAGSERITGSTSGPQQRQQQQQQQQRRSEFSRGRQDVFGTLARAGPAELRIPNVPESVTLRSAVMGEASVVAAVLAAVTSGIPSLPDGATLLPEQKAWSQPRIGRQPTEHAPVEGEELDKGGALKPVMNSVFGHNPIPDRLAPRARPNVVPAPVQIAEGGIVHTGLLLKTANELTTSNQPMGLPGASSTLSSPPGTASTSRSHLMSPLESRRSRVS